MCSDLEKRGRYQKAANLIYYCVAGDSNNEELRRQWDRLIAKTNEVRRGREYSAVQYIGNQTQCRHCLPCLINAPDKLNLFGAAMCHQRTSRGEERKRRKRGTDQ